MINILIQLNNRVNQGNINTKENIRITFLP